MPPSSEIPRSNHVDELGIRSGSSYYQQYLDHAARDTKARHLFLTSTGAVAGCLWLYTSGMIAPSPEMTVAYGLDTFADFGADYLSFTDHMVIGDWRRGRSF